MTSLGSKRVVLPGWNPTYTIQGQLYHRIGTMFPQDGNTPKFLQIYFLHNSKQEVQHRLSITDSNPLRPHIIETLQQMLHQENTYVAQLKTAAQLLAEKQSPDLKVVIHEEKRPSGEHPRRYNSPTGDEVAILMPNEPTCTRDIIIHQQDGALKHISELHCAYDPLQYPLLFPYGSDGYNLYLKSKNQRKISQMQFYSYHIQDRKNNYLLKTRYLLQQYLVDMYCKIETERLQYLRREHKTLRADNYNSLRDSILGGDADPRNLGQRIILPSSYTAGPRYLHERQQDAITYVRLFGRPNLFITTTTNPKWPEILNNTFPKQSATDRPDIVVRVFHEKLKKLLALLKEGAFGTMCAWLYSVEFQKRGLPHAHILIWLRNADKISPDDINAVVSAEIPCPRTQPILHQIVKANMIHGPCGLLNPRSPCMKDGKCSKGFPKDFKEATEQGNDGYPKYRRKSPEDSGNTITIQHRRTGPTTQLEVDNRWIVPYNPWLLRQMNCHTNVEICSSIKCIKYVLKYIHKGSDQAVFSLESNNNDEIQQFQNARFVGSMEAAHRILGLPMHQHYPPVMQLAIHLENGQRVYFTETNAVNRGLSEPPKTTLTEFFKLCQNDTFAKTLLYVEVPQYYTWDNKNKQWNRRKRGLPHSQHPDIFRADTIGRIYTVNPKQIDCYFLRLLLNHVRGPTAFKDLTTVQEFHHKTYREACLALGLIEDDQHLHKALQEAAESQSPQHLRLLFAIILVNCEPSNPMQLWQNNHDHLAEDYIHKTGDRDTSYNQCLHDIQNLLLSMPGSLTLSDYGLPKPVTDQHAHSTKEYLRYTSFPREQQELYVSQHEHLLTCAQADIYHTFIHKITDNKPGLTFLDAPGGTGKTFLLKLLLAKVRSSGHIAIATASSGIAATLLPGGATLHSMFKVPLDVQQKDTPTCAIKKGSTLAKIITMAKLILVDEAPMAHRAVYEAIDRTLQDIKGNSQPFGGIPTILSGDFRQILPVVKNGTRSNIVNATLKKSPLWTQTDVLKLHTNMRALQTKDHNAQQFSNFLMEIGDGRYKIQEQPDTISLPRNIHHINCSGNLIKEIYGDILTQSHQGNLRRYSNQIPGSQLADGKSNFSPTE
jgi:hypothetical protein